jgi:hypothetical protein
VFIQSSRTVHPRCMDIATGLKENGYVIKKNQMKKENRIKK